MDIQQTTTERSRFAPRSREREDVVLTPGDAIRTTLLNRVCWSAVFAGVVMAFVTHIILNLIGVSIGAVTFAAAAPGAIEFTWGAAIWASISGIIAAFIGGYTAGRLVGEPEKSTARWHGLVAWATSILILALVMTTAAGGMIASPMQVLASQGLGAETAAAAPVQPGVIAAAAIASVAALLLGALAAWFGGGAGTVEPRTHHGDTRSEFVH